jgi:hypothetical protein
MVNSSQGEVRLLGKTQAMNFRGAISPHYSSEKIKKYSKEFGENVSMA